MSGNFKHCLSLLHSNEKQVMEDAKEVLRKLCNNILKNPQESRYRKILLSNATISSKLLIANGGIESLFEAGFIENDDGLLLPTHASLTGIQDLYNILSDKKTLTNLQTANNAPKDVQKDEPKKSNYFEYLSNYFKDILRYENKTLQTKVMSILPLEKLHLTALNKFREIQRNCKSNDTTQEYIVIEDLLLVELLSWFKFKFFTWVNSPACTNCTGECALHRHKSSSNPQISRIEIHKCKICGYENEFARYTDPEVLLYTRKGRCGEWANCFTLICRTLGYDARLVFESDHVWTEVWSIAHNRWIHLDASENVIDRPLIYEKGWGKKLAYVIAVSRDEIQDVTWRYTRNYDEVICRRNYCSEEALIQFFHKLNSARQNSEGYSSTRKKFVAKRRAIELAEMLNAPPGCTKPCETLENDSDYGGRTSGSLSWRLARGEIKDVKYNLTHWVIPKGVSSFQLTYSIIDDTYTIKDILSDKTLETKQKWQNGIALAEGGIFRKEEDDWKMVYLARSPGSETGKIKWTFIIEDNENMCIDLVKLQAATTTFNAATIKWEIEGVLRNDKSKKENKIIYVDNTENFETKELKNTVKLSISASLSGGKGDTAWQHAQLFRQSLNTNSQEPSMIIRIDLK